MADELKSEAILSFLGFEADKIKTEEDFKANFESKFGIKDQLLNDEKFIAPIFGKRIGSISSKLLTTAHKMGIELSREKAKDMKVEDMIEYVFTQTADMQKKAMDDFEKLNKGTADEQVKVWKDKYTQVDAKAKEWEGMANTTTANFEAFKKEQATKGRLDSINGFKKTAIGKLEFKQDITPVERMGFESVLADKYDFDLDENQNPFIKDKKTGQRIPSTKVTGQFKSFDEILQEELIANKLAKINHQGGKPAPKYGQSVAQTPEGEPEKKTLFIHPNARMAASTPAVKRGL